jgi:polar amino acid transport system substrate-binding protein
MIIHDFLIAKNMIRLIGIVLICLSSFHASANVPQTSKTESTTTLTILMSEQLDQVGQRIPVSPHMQRFFNYLEQELNLNIKVASSPWARVMRNGEHGLGLIFGISKTAERERIFNFSDPIFGHRVWLITLCEKQFIYRTLNDLKNKTISISRASSVSEEFDREAGVLFKVDFDATTTSARFLKLAAHRSDALVFYSSLDAKMLEQRINLEYSDLNATPPGHSSHKLCVMNNPIANNDIHFALSKKMNPEILTRINIALSHAKRKGLLPSFIEDYKE